MNKKLIITILVLLMLVLGGAAIYIAVNINEQPSVIPEESLASGGIACGSYGCSVDSDCSGYVDNKQAYSMTCDQVVGNDISQQKCIIICPAGIPRNGDCSCGIKCGETGCVSDTDCIGYNGTQANSIWCSGQRTSTTRCIIRCAENQVLSGYCTCVSVTPTKTPSATPSATPSVTLSNTPVTKIPQTALVSDEVDRVLIGIGMVFVGIIFYKNNFYYSAFFFFKNTFVENPKKNSVDKFEKKVQKKYKSK